MSLERTHAELRTVLAALAAAWETLKTKPGLIMLSATLGLVLWGPKGVPFFEPWVESLVGGALGEMQRVRQLISFASGMLLLVAVPFALIRLRFKERLHAFGLGRGDVRLGVTFASVLFAISLLPFLFASRDQGMWREYPLVYQGMTPEQLRQGFSWSSFVVYELLYSTFFFVIEFIFRGYLLFGLRKWIGNYAVLVQLLPYTVWHLPKPFVELIGTPLWGIAVAAISLRVGSIWYVFFVHWLLNVLMDTCILLHRGVIGGG